MILEKGNIWNIFNDTDVFIITANSYIRKDNKLVMGRGLAKEAVEQIPGIQNRFGQIIKGKFGHLGKYGLILVMNADMKKKPDVIGIFQVKQGFKSKACLSLIKYSTKLLNYYARKFKSIRIDMNFPGIGNGNLSRKSVISIISELPDNVHIWEYEKTKEI